MATTDELREILADAKRADEAALGQGMDPVATHLRNSYQRKAEALRQEALTLAICELLDTELVLADPTELADPGVCRECGCTEARACTHARNGQIERCGWAEPGLCTACVPGQKKNWIHPPRIVAAPGG